MNLTFDELVDREAQAIAKAAIETELTRQDLPTLPESTMRQHIEALSRSAKIRQEATERVKLRRDAYTETIDQIDPPEVMDI